MERYNHWLGDAQTDVEKIGLKILQAQMGLVTLAHEIKALLLKTFKNWNFFRFET